MSSSEEYVEDTCFGCFVNDTCGIPYHEIDEDVVRWPCNLCLVKAVCDVGICDKYRKYSRSLRPWEDIWL